MIIETIKSNNGSLSKAATELGISRTALRCKLGQIKLDEIRNGHESNKIVTGTSTLFKYDNDDGTKILQWVKEKPEHKVILSNLRSAVDELLSELPKYEYKGKSFDEGINTLTLYTLTDCHIGAYSWKEETGSDWDLKIAEKSLTSAIARLVSASYSKYGLLNLQGDFLHYSGMESKTELHGHHLDSDSRQNKMIRVSVRVIRNCIESLLSRHDHVIISLVEGNHDISATGYLAEIINILYEDNPWVEVLTSPKPYKVYQYGKTFIGMTHGHLKKVESLPELFSSMFPKEYGETKYRYIHCGHRHHETMRETSNFKVTQHSTFAAPDAYAARGGWINKRQIRSVTYSPIYGEISTNVVTPEMIVV